MVDENKDNLSKELEELKKQKEALEEQMRPILEKREKLSKREKKILANNKKILLCENAIERLNGNIKAFREEIEKLERKIEELRKEAAELSKGKVDVEDAKKYSKISREVKALEGEILACKGAIENKLEEIRKENSIKDGLKEDEAGDEKLQEVKREIEELNEILKPLEDELIGLREKISNKEKEITRIKRKEKLEEILATSQEYPDDEAFYLIVVKNYNTETGVERIEKRTVPAIVMELMNHGFLEKPRSYSYEWDQGFMFDDHYESGQSVTISKCAGDEWQISKVEEAKAIGNLSTEEYLDEEISIECGYVSVEISARELLKAGVSLEYFGSSLEMLKKQSQDKRKEIERTAEVKTTDIIVAEQKASLSKKIIGTIKGFFDKLKSKGKGDIEH